MPGSSFFVKRGIEIKLQDNNYISITNNSNKVFEGIMDILNYFSRSMFFSPIKLEPNQTKSYPLFKDNFYDEWINKKFIVKLYKNNKVFYEKVFNNKDRCFVIYSDKNFEALTEQLIIGLDKYTNEDIYYYTLDFDSTLEYKNLYKIRYNINLSDTIHNKGQYIQFIKPKIFLDILSKGFNQVIFLDADIQVTPNIKNIFNHTIPIHEGPLIQKNPWEFTLVGGKYVPGPLLSKFMELPPQIYPQGITNVLGFNQSHISLFVMWEKVCFSSEIQEIRKEEFLHDELILNCLLWKFQLTPKHINFTINVLNLEDVEFFYNFKNDGTMEWVDMNQYNKGHDRMSFFPYDTSDLIGFHTVKDPIEAHKINEYIKQKHLYKF